MVEESGQIAYDQPGIPGRVSCVSLAPSAWACGEKQQRTGAVVQQLLHAYEQPTS